MKGTKEASLFSCLSSSLCIHGTMVAAIALAPQITALMPESPTATTVEFTVAQNQNNKYGQQIQTKATGPLPEAAATPKNTPPPAHKKVAIKKITKASGKKPARSVVVKKKAAPKKVMTQKESPVAIKNAKLEQKKQLQKKEAEALLAKQQAEKKRLAQELQALKDLKKKQQEELEALKQKAEAEEIARQLQQEKDELAALEREQAEEDRLALLEEQRLAKLQQIEDQLAQEKARADQLAKANAAKVAAARGSSQKSSRAQSDLAYGVPSGVRAVTDLRQVPGNRPPQYTQLARLRKLQGQGELAYYVTENGKVTQLRLTRSTGHSELDHQALQAIKKYRFYPGQAGWTKHSVVFELKGSAQQAGGRLRVKR